MRFMTVCLQYQSVYVKKEVKTTSTRMQLLAAVVLLGVFAVRVWAKLEATDIGYQVARERQQMVKLDMERRELELQRSLLLRPDSLSRAARERVGLSEHNLEQTITVSY
jgi:hypothetical protein